MAGLKSFFLYNLFVDIAEFFNVFMGNILAKNGLLVLISGPSGVGKGTIVNMLRERLPWLVFVTSLTTRAPRPGEQEGQQYHFVSHEEFERGIAEGRFLEYAQVHHLDYYGVLKAPVMEALALGRVVVREVDVQGAASIVNALPPAEVLTIFIRPPELAVLLQHIEGRGHLPAEELQRRLDSAKREMQAAEKFDFQVVNPEGQVEQCYNEVVEIIKAEMKRRGVSQGD